jgi:hypothetical protein
LPFPLSDYTLQVRGSIDFAWKFPGKTAIAC